MQQLGHVLFLLGILFAIVAGLGFEHPWLPVGLAIVRCLRRIGEIGRC